MLQYPVQLPPLSLSSSKRTPATGRDRDVDDRRNGHARLAKLAVHDRIVAPRSPALPISPLSNSIALSPSSSASASTYDSPFPSPLSTTPAKPIHRSPLVSSSRQLPSPVPRSPHPLRSDLPSFDNRSSGRSSISSCIVDVLCQGDLVGEGIELQGEVIKRVPISSSEPRVDHDEPAKEFEVVRKLGSGSYAVVYLVREVLSRPQASDDGHAITIGRMDLDDGSPGNQSTEYGREYAIKVLSKANLDEEALTAQLFEATIHQSLPAHPNIVTLHRTLETSSFLLLLLEFVPGEDLFYFLEQARDHYEMDPSTTDLSTSPPVSDSSCASRTPPTPSLLSSLNPAQLLSRTRLRLIASMFSQMCEAVATCHDHSVFHRDIKPENFIVTDGWTTLPDGRSERKVVVKLTDFGLSTTDVESADMDCGSAPYMSFECRNNLHPTYSPRAADVWSLGIVLINMLYHYNPWTDTTLGVCSSFAAYRQQPVSFFMQRFTGMTLPVAEFLADNVFCILDNPKDDSKRISARAFGAWIKDLPDLLGGPSIRGHTRNISIASVQGHRLASIPHSRRPSLRNSVVGEALSISRRASRNFSRQPSLGPAYEHQALESPITLPPVIDRESEQEISFTENDHDRHDHEQDAEADGVEGEGGSRSASTHKRRKRGARKGKGNGTSALSPTSPASTHDATLETLAQASQALAREISRTSRHSQASSLSLGVDSSRAPHSASIRSAPYPMPPNPGLPPLSLLNSSVPLSLSSPGSGSASISKKPSKWKLSFGKGSNAAAASAAGANKLSAAPEEAALPPVENSSSKQMSATASNVTSLLNSLNAPPSPPPGVKTPHTPAARERHRDHEDDAASWNRGRRPKHSPYSASPNGSATWGPSSGSAFGPSRGSPERRYGGAYANSDKRSERGISPSSTRSGRPLASSASSMASSNWRSSMSSAGTSTSAFTRYSNNSTRSVSTAATSVSAQSWRSQGSKLSQQSQQSQQSYDQHGNQMPANVKFVTGTPWELYQLPRQMYPNPDDAKFGGPPQRKRRANKPKDLMLDTINERPQHQKSPLGQRQDAATSTTDLDHVGRPRADSGSRERDGGGSEAEGSPRKVQKGQINALAKMLSALRR